MTQKITSTFIHVAVLMALVSGTTIFAKKDKDSVLDAINQRVAYIAKKITGDTNCSQIITAADIGTAGYTITSPGTYCLGSDVVFNPASIGTAVPVSFTGGGGSGAAGYAAVTQGVVIGVVMTDGGTGYTSAPTPVFGGSGTGAVGVAEITNGSVTAVMVTGGGSGYADTMVAAITVAVSNAVVSLQSHILSQVNKDQPFVNGIVVNPGLDNVIITNGTVRDFSFCGIQAGQTPPVANPAVLTNMHVVDVIALNNGTQDGTPFSGYLGMGGIALYSVQFASIVNCNANENFYAGATLANTSDFYGVNSHFDGNMWANAQSFATLQNFPSAYGMIYVGDDSIPTLDNVAFRDCTFNDTSGLGNACGFDAFPTVHGGTTFSNLSFESCAFNGTTALVTSTAVAYLYTGVGTFNAIGFQVQGAGNGELLGVLSFKDCQFNNATLTFDIPGNPTISPANMNSIGVEEVFWMGSMVFDGCTSANNTIVLTSGCANKPGNNGEAFAGGFDIIGPFGSPTVSITNCDFYGMSVQNGTGAPLPTNLQVESCGISLNAVTAYVGNCNFIGSTNTGNLTNTLWTQALGLDSFGMLNMVVENCFSSGHTQASQNTGSDFSQAAGFKVSTSVGNSATFINCVASGISDTGDLGAHASGFTTRDPGAGGNTTPGLNYVFDGCVADQVTVGAAYPTAGAGFDIYVAEAAKLINCKSEGNNVGLLVSDNGTVYTANNIVANNIFLNNTYYGILDTSFTSTTNAYYQNQAKANGPTPAVAQPNDTNYSGGILNTTGTLIRTWVLPNPPSAVDNTGTRLDPLDNISINY